MWNKGLSLKAPYSLRSRLETIKENDFFVLLMSFSIKSKTGLKTIEHAGASLVCCSSRL